MRASHYQQWRVLLSYILFALRNRKDLKSQVLFLQGETGTLEGRLPILWGKRGEKEITQDDSLDGLLDKSLQKVNKIKIGALMWTWCAIMNMYSY